MHKPAASPDQLEREIARTRADIDRKLALLQERMSPRRVAGHMAGSVGAQGGAFARNLGAALRDNPVPALLLGIGVLWLMVASRPNGEAQRFEGQEPDLALPPEPAAAPPTAAALAAAEHGQTDSPAGMPSRPSDNEMPLGAAVGRR